MRKRLKILHWPTGYPDPEYDLPYRLIFVAEHVRAASLYHDNFVLFISPEAPRGQRWIHVSRTLEGNFHVIRIRHRKFQIHASNRLFVYMLIGWELLHMLVSGFRPDIIHAHIFANARLPMFIAKLLNIPLVVTEHWTALCRKDVLPPERLQLARQIYEQANIVLPVCEYLRKCIEKNTGACINYKIILNTVDISIFYWNQNKNLVNRQERILTVARLEIAKDIPTLLRAIGILKREGRPISLDIIGRGDQKPLFKLSKELGIEHFVTFHGVQPKNEIAEFMRQADVFVLSSLWENSPCVIGEALCCGLPVVATDVGGVPELVPVDSGLLVPPKDPQALANALTEVLDNKDKYKRKRISQDAQARFSHRAIGSQLDKVYCSLVA